MADAAMVRDAPREPEHRYILGELLGSGTAAHVHVGTCPASGQQVAVKCLPKRKGRKDKTALIKAEVSSVVLLGTRTGAAARCRLGRRLRPRTGAAC